MQIDFVSFLARRPSLVRIFSGILERKKIVRSGVNQPLIVADETNLAHVLLELWG